MLQHTFEMKIDGGQVLSEPLKHTHSVLVAVTPVSGC